ADEPAYTTHDLDDGLRSSMIDAQILEGVALWEILKETYNWRGPNLGDIERHRMIRHLVGLLVTDIVQTTDQRLKESAAKSALDLQKLNYNVIGYSEDMQRRNRELKDFLYQKLYRHYRVVRMQVKAENIIKDLFDAYQSEPAMLPTQFQKNIALRGLERTICDYIAGMTDRFAIEEHQRLFDPFLKT
ncbi:MAG: deoxyguanosinetriphosphate triphosphohydrolase, partial [Chloroflexi bacterium]|nr:deoxyguanosinetriphosphate triphosphohydrolase [Chloroflexota bacterium]